MMLIYLLWPQMSKHTDLNKVEGQDEFEDYNVIGLGNSFLIDYNYEASVGQLPTASITYDCSNMKFDVYEDADPPTFPSLKLGINDPVNPPRQKHFL